MNSQSPFFLLEISVPKNPISPIKILNFILKSYLVNENWRIKLETHYPMVLSWKFSKIFPKSSFRILIMVKMMKSVTLKIKNWFREFVLHERGAQKHWYLCGRGGLPVNAEACMQTESQGSQATMNTVAYAANSEILPHALDFSKKINYNTYLEWTLGVHSGPNTHKSEMKLY